MFCSFFSFLKNGNIWEYFLLSFVDIIQYGSTVDKQVNNMKKMEETLNREIFVNFYVVKAI